MAMSSTGHHNRTLMAAGAWILLCAVFRFFYAGMFPLVPDETNYWQWGRHLALGYHDQAPLIAWAIRAATMVLGNTETGVRLPSIIALTVSSAYLTAFAARWFNPRMALNTALLTQSVLAFNVGGLLATADGLQAMAWAAAAYHVARGYEEDTWRQWLVGGFWFGIGMLSKYTMILFLPFAYLFGLMSRRHRHRLAGIKPYAGVALGTLMFSPVIIWNARHHWNSVRHVAYIGGANEAFSIHWNFLGDYVGALVGLLSPLVFILVIMAWSQAIVAGKALRDWRIGYLFMTSFPVVAGFALLSLHSRVYGNWPMAGFLTASVMAAAYGPGPHRPLQRKGRFRLWKSTIATSYGISALVLLQVVWPVLPIPLHLDRTSTEIPGWDDLGRRVEMVAATMPDPGHTFIFGLRYQTASELAFYVPGQPQTLSINRWHRPNVYDYWWRDADRIGWDAVGVTDDPASHTNKLNQVFERVDPPVALSIYRPAVFGRIGGNDTPAKVFYIYRAYGFKGGLRWIPADPSDIRAE